MVDISPYMFYHVMSPLCRHRKIGKDIKTKSGYNPKTDRMVFWDCEILLDGCNASRCPLIQFVEPPVLARMRNILEDTPNERNK
jgi:hypothetical protein